MSAPVPPTAPTRGAARRALAAGRWRQAPDPWSWGASVVVHAVIFGAVLAGVSGRAAPAREGAGPLRVALVEAREVVAEEPSTVEVRPEVERVPEALPLPLPEAERLPEAAALPEHELVEVAEPLEVRPPADLPLSLAGERVARPPAPAPAPPPVVRPASPVGAPPPPTPPVSAPRVQPPPPGGGTAPPRLVATHLPLYYPPEAVRRGLEGVVSVRYTVRADGRVEDVEVVGPSGHAVLDDAALASVRQWRYRAPGRDVRVQRDVRFDL